MTKAADTTTAPTRPTTGTTFEKFREEVTGWIRPGHDHGCPPVEILPGLWTAHYDDIDTHEKLQAVSKDIRLVVNSALSQCPARTGFYGPNVVVMEVQLEDDPDERKYFDKGEEAIQSTCRDGSVPLHKRCAGDLFQWLDPVADAIHATLQKGEGHHVLVHCKASLSRSPALVIGYLMKYHKMTLYQAGKFLKSKFDATWPCDRFSYDLVEYEQRLAKPYRLSHMQVAGIAVASSMFGAALTLFWTGHKNSSRST